MRYRTLEEVKAHPTPILTAANIETFISTDAMTIRHLARHDPAKLGFAVLVTGRRLKIPKDAFIAWYTGRAGEVRA